MLQAIVGLQSGGVIHPALLHALQLWLEPNDVTERIHADALDGSPYAKALAAAAVLRRCAARLGPEVDMRHYYGGLLFEAARLVMAARERSGREAPPHYVHAALGAALLAAVLESWPGRPWRPTEDAPDGDRLVLDRVNKRLYVPDCGRWLPLPEKLFRLLSLLDEKACRLVTYEEIDERVFDGRAGAGAIYNLVGQVRRLLREAGCDDRRYIRVVRGLGYVLQPTGVPCSD